MTRYIYGAAALVLLMVGSVMYGEHRVQSQWDLERARQEVIADQARKTDEAARKSIEEQHRKDVEYAKSKAGRAAVAAWLKSHGLLPDGTSMPGSGGNQANCTTSSDGGSDTQPGLADRIKEFASECRAGAQMNLEWREWAIREGLKVGE